MVRVASEASTLSASGDAIVDALSRLDRKLEGPYDLLLVCRTCEHDDEEIIRVVRDRALVGASVHGGTSCLGVMTGSGFHSVDGRGLGVWAIRDPEGAYGTGFSELGSDPRSAGAAAVREALKRAGRPAGMPALIWLTVTPGWEEQILLGIEDVVDSVCSARSPSAIDSF